MREEQITVERTARYFVIGEPLQPIKRVYLAFHGYGQLASLFAKKFEFLASPGTIVIVPEGLSRFYLDNKYERIGASWITREMRDSEISDSIKYINDILKKYLQEDTEIHLFGFSQGCSMALRWANQFEGKVNSIVLWAGFFAKGLSDMINLEKLANVNCKYVYGDRDEFLVQNPAIAQSFQDEIAKSGTFELISFDGTHRVPNDVLGKVYGEVN